MHLLWTNTNVKKTCTNVENLQMPGVCCNNYGWKLLLSQEEISIYSLRYVMKDIFLIEKY